MLAYFVFVGRIILREENEKKRGLISTISEID